MQPKFYPIIALYQVVLLICIHLSPTTASQASTQKHEAKQVRNAAQQVRNAAKQVRKRDSIETLHPRTHSHPNIPISRHKITTHSKNERRSDKGLRLTKRNRKKQAKSIIVGMPYTPTYTPAKSVKGRRRNFHSNNSGKRSMIPGIVLSKSSLKSMNRRDIDHLDHLLSDSGRLSLYEKHLLNSALNPIYSANTSLDDNPDTAKRGDIQRPMYRDSDTQPNPSQLDAADRHNILRQELLKALSKRIEARNLLMHEKQLLRERMLQDQLQPGRSRINNFQNEFSSHEIGRTTARMMEHEINRLSDINGVPPVERYHPIDSGIRSHEIFAPSPSARSEHRNQMMELPQQSRAATIAGLGDADLLTNEAVGSVRRTGIERNYVHNMYPEARNEDNLSSEDLNNVGINQPQSDSIFDDPTDSMLPAHEHVGALGDETLPYGSLGSMKEEYPDPDPDPDYR